MSRAFRRRRRRRSKGSELTAAFHPAEADLLRSLVTQLLDLLGPSREPGAGTASADDPLAAVVGFTDVARPEDPVLLRLFPDAYRDDEGAAGEFRRFTETGLRERKSRTAQVVLATLDAGTAARPDRLDVVLDEPAAGAWLRTLTDLRLALGTRLGVAEGDEARWTGRAEDDPLAYVHSVYEWLGWMQETLVRALDGD